VQISGHGISVDLPRGWEGRIYRRRRGDPTLHAGNFILPLDDGDFGSSSISIMPSDGIVIVLTGYRRALAGEGLFGHQGLPLPLPAFRLRRRALQRIQRGRWGIQRFFTEGGRPFCIYVVVGSMPDPAALLRRANRVLSTLSIASRGWSH
jgi:hypothetical protein